MKNWNYINGAEIGNAGITDKEFKSESDLRRWCMDHGYTYTSIGGGYYRLENDKPGSSRPDLEAHVTGNSKTGNDTMREWATSKPKSVGNSGIEQEFFKKLADDAKKEEKKDDKEVDKLVGNYQWDRAYYKQKIDPAKWNEFEKNFEKLIYDQNLERYDIEDRMKLNPELRSEKYKIIEKQRRDVESMINKYKKVGNRTVRTEEKNGWVVAYVNDHKIGHAKLVDVGSGWQANGNIRLGIPGKLAICGSFFEFYKEKPSADRVAQDLLRAWENKWGSNADAKAFIGNKYKPDDKFAYVMREFDEGKLKTPDGKVVTDPAQAKAIAYSESKKAENGLARARNAMNKKTGNSSEVTIIIKGQPGHYTYDIKSTEGGYFWGDSRNPGYFKTKEEAIRKAQSNYPNSKVLNP